MFDQAGLDGVGRLDGPLTPEYGVLTGILRCTTCSASWGGPIGMGCPWCQRSLELARHYQAEILLRGVGLDPADTRFAASVEAWGQRLQRAVEVGIIDRRQAETSWRREVARAVA